jgi:hypothetical protein
LPALLSEFEDCREQPWAFAWAMVAAGDDAVRLAWTTQAADAVPSSTPGGLDVLRFQLGQGAPLERSTGTHCWTWSRDA